MKEQNFERMSDGEAFDFMKREMEKRNESVVWTLFHGIHRSVIQCSICNHRSLTFEPFSILTLSFPSNGRTSLRLVFVLFLQIPEVFINFFCFFLKYPFVNDESFY